MWYWSDGPDGWGVVWMGVMMAVMWLPILVLLVWLLRGFERPRHEPPPPMQTSPEPDAREIARRAYARGDLVRERYLRIVEDLRQTEG
jgi:uncharacterized membrane protein